MFSYPILRLPAIVNLCRDEVTNIVRVKLEEIFPLVFNINGLGAGITCGVTGLKAGLSHSPECSVRTPLVRLQDAPLTHLLLLDKLIGQGLYDNVLMWHTRAKI